MERAYYQVKFCCNNRTIKVLKPRVYPDAYLITYIPTSYVDLQITLKRL